MNKFKIKYLTLFMVMILAAASISGCNNDTPAEDTPSQEASDNPTPEDNNQDEPNEQQPANEPTEQTPAAPAQTPIGERSPIAVSRIEPTTPTYPIYPTVSGTDDLEDPTQEPEEEPDPHDHEPIPNLFPIGECQVEVNGEYDSDFARDMVAAINAARTDYMIGEVTRNTSLLACADIRCKEQAYFVGHFRPDGSSWRSVAPGYVQGECIAVDYRTAEDVVRAWLNVNKTRVNLMNPDFTQVGTSVYNIDGTLFVAVEFGY